MSANFLRARAKSDLPVLVMNHRFDTFLRERHFTLQGIMSRSAVTVFSLIFSLSKEYIYIIHKTEKQLENIPSMLIELSTISWQSSSCMNFGLYGIYLRGSARRGAHLICILDLIQFLFRAPKSFRRELRNLRKFRSWSRGDCQGGGGRRQRNRGVDSKEMRRSEKKRREERSRELGEDAFILSPRATILTTPVSRRHL